MDKKELYKIGQQLCPGRNWKIYVSNAIGVDVKTVQRWANGEFNIGHKEQMALLELLKAQTKNSAEMVRSMCIKLKLEQQRMKDKT